MFRPKWSEGQGLSKESRREIPLMEDDVNALQTICCAIYHRNYDIPQSITPKEILQIAIDADKYDLNVTVKYASKSQARRRNLEGGFRKWSQFIVFLAVLGI